MISRLPSWVEAGAFSLALMAGVVNAVGLLGFSHQAVSHLTGTSTLLGARLRGVPLDRRKARLFLLLISGFILGGTLGALGFARWQFQALLLPACMALALAGLYQLWLRRQGV
ncbi:MAG: DUF1275 family protein [Pseudomonadota bacterium]|nr:DUF1275 family protein [Pseudomonadota bacterium]